MKGDVWFREPVMGLGMVIGARVSVAEGGALKIYSSDPDEKLVGQRSWGEGDDRHLSEAESLPYRELLVPLDLVEAVVA